MFYDLYGLTLQSAIPLPARVASRQQTADHCITWGDRRPVTTAPPPGDIIARWCLTETFGATLSRSVDRYIYRIHTRCDFEITHDLGRVIVHFTSAGRIVKRSRLSTPVMTHSTGPISGRVPIFTG